MYDGDPPTIGRPIRVRGPLQRRTHRSRRGTVEGDDLDPCRKLPRLERNRATIRRPLGRAYIDDSSREAAKPRTVFPHDVDLSRELPIAAGGIVVVPNEGDTRAVR